MEKRLRTTFGLMAAAGVAALSVGCVSANAEGMKKSHRLLLKSAIEDADYMADIPGISPKVFSARLKRRRMG
jgi:hypothetical protein